MKWEVGMGGSDCRFAEKAVNFGDQSNKCMGMTGRLLGMPPLASPWYRLRSPSSSRSSTRFATTRSLPYDYARITTIAVTTMTLRHFFFASPI